MAKSKKLTRKEREENAATQVAEQNKREHDAHVEMIKAAKHPMTEETRQQQK